MYPGAMMAEFNDTQFVALVAEVVENLGCHLADIDFDEKVIRLDGPEEAKRHCAKALRDILG